MPLSISLPPSLSLPLSSLFGGSQRQQLYCSICRLSVCALAARVYVQVTGSPVRTALFLLFSKPLLLQQCVYITNIALNVCVCVRVCV